MKYLESIKRDLKKAEWLEMNDFNLIEINEDEINQISKKFFLTKFDIVL